LYENAQEPRQRAALTLALASHDPVERQAAEDIEGADDQALQIMDLLAVGTRVAREAALRRVTSRVPSMAMKRRSPYG